MRDRDWQKTYAIHQQNREAYGKQVKPISIVVTQEIARCVEVWRELVDFLANREGILRDNGYTCEEGVVYYGETKQRVRLPITPQLALWVEERIAAARQTAAGAIPVPLVASPKCPRCSLVTVCLPGVGPPS